MNVNFGLFPPPPEGTPKSERKPAHGAPGAGSASRLGLKSRRARSPLAFARKLLVVA